MEPLPRSIDWNIYQPKHSANTTLYSIRVVAMCCNYPSWQGWSTILNINVTIISQTVTTVSCQTGRNEWALSVQFIIFSIEIYRGLDQHLENLTNDNGASGKNAQTQCSLLRAALSRWWNILIPGFIGYFNINISNVPLRPYRTQPIRQVKGH